MPAEACQEERMLLYRLDGEAIILPRVAGARDESSVLTFPVRCPKSTPSGGYLGPFRLTLCVINIYFISTPFSNEI